MSFETDRTTVRNYITLLLSQANGFLNALQGVANVSLITGTTELPEKYNYASVPTVNFPLQSSGVPITWPSSEPPVASPTIALTSFDQIAVPEFLGDSLLAPTTEFSYVEEEYISILMDPLKAKLLTDLTDGGYGIETDDEEALFNRSRDRAIKTALTKIGEAGHAVAMRGFPLPPGELSIHVDRAYQEMQDTVSDTSRDITLERSKLFVENRQFTINQIRELEVVTIGLYNSIRERALNVSKATVDYAIALYNTQLARFKLSLDRAKTATDTQVANRQIQFEQERTKLELYRNKILGYEANVRRQIDTTRAQIDYLRADTETARLVNDGTIARAQLQQKVIEATTQQNIQISNMTIENARVRLQGLIASLNFTTEATKFGASQFFAQITALENTINTLSVQTSTGT